MKTPNFHLGSHLCPPLPETINSMLCWALVKEIVIFIHFEVVYTTNNSWFAPKYLFSNPKLATRPSWYFKGCLSFWVIQYPEKSNGEGEIQTRSSQLFIFDYLRECSLPEGTIGLAIYLNQVVSTMQVISTWQRVIKETRAFSGLFVCLVAIDLPESYLRSGIIMAFKIHGISDWMYAATMWHGRYSKISWITDLLCIDFSHLSRCGNVSWYHSLSFAARSLGCHLCLYFSYQLSVVVLTTYLLQARVILCTRGIGTPGSKLICVLLLVFSNYWCKWQPNLIDTDLHLIEMFGVMHKSTRVAGLMSISPLRSLHNFT